MGTRSYDSDGNGSGIIRHHDLRCDFGPPRKPRCGGAVVAGQDLIVVRVGDAPDDDPDQKPFFLQLLGKCLQFCGGIGLKPDVRCKKAV